MFAIDINDDLLNTFVVKQEVMSLMRDEWGVRRRYGCGGR